MKTYNHAFITGASSGIGAQMARVLADHGTHVILAARRQEQLDEVADQIRRRGGKADVQVLDVADQQRVEEVIKRWDNTTGGLDLVVANAGVGRTKPAHRLTWDDIQPVLEVNVIGAFATLLAGLQCMIPRGQGTLAAVSSLAAMRGLPASGAYSASKAALSTFLETLRADVERKGVTIVDIRPGFVRTPMTDVNKFHMPMLMNVTEAAEIAVRGMERGKAVVAFPWPMAGIMSLAQSSPNMLWRKVATKMR